MLFSSSRYSGSCSFNTAEKKEKKTSCGKQASCFLEIWQQFHVSFYEIKMLTSCSAELQHCFRMSAAFRSTELLQKGQAESSFDSNHLHSSSSDRDWNCSCSSTSPLLNPGRSSYLYLLPRAQVIHSLPHIHHHMISLSAPAVLEISLYSSSWLSSI